jgi:tripartite-type tricarboxylate transporter receptor subunit TctC
MRHLLFAVASFAALATSAAAQAWPSRPITIIVPSAPGDGSDITARALAEKLRSIAPQGIVIDNRTGAGGVTGTLAAARAPADGYTFIMGNAGSHGINPAILSNPPYDVMKDFQPVSLIYRAPNIFLAAPKTPASTMAELVALARARSGGLNYASGGVGSSAHMNAEFIKVLTGISASHVPYRGSSPALNDLIGGQVDFMAVNLPPAIGLVKTGQVKPLAVTTKLRSPALPDVPTMEEAGFPGYETVAWFGLFAPKGVPEDVVTRLNGVIKTACADPDLGKRLEALGGELVCNTAAEFSAFVETDIKRWRDVAQKGGIRLDVQQ